MLLLICKMIKILNAKIFFATFSLCIISTVSINAQSVNYKIVGNDVSNAKKLNIRPYVAFFIPPTEVIDGLPVTVNIDAQYWTSVADFRGGISYGTFKGVNIGGTLHLKDGIKSVNHKFVMSRTSNGKTETVKYLRAKADVYKISGPCADLAIGSLKGAGFYSKLDFGWDFQTLGRAYAEINGRNYKGNRNGWLSFKFQGVVATTVVDMTDYFGLGAGTSKYLIERKMAVGVQVNPSFAYRPWKKSTFYAAIPLGYMGYLGVSDAPSTTTKGIPILSINIGLQLSI